MIKARVYLRRKIVDRKPIYGANPYIKKGDKWYCIKTEKEVPVRTLKEFLKEQAND